MAGGVHAPEIDRPGLEWFNVPGPSSLATLKGKLAILDFWTFCCINCMHILPTLSRIEEALPAEVAVEKTALASVWDLELDGDRLFLTNAGTHQLGELNLDTGAVRRLAGGGAENIEDGPAHQALLAQPSGLALNDARDTLYFTDSETSAIRALNLAGAAEVRTLVGTGLYDFGARNGAFADALFQHPLSIAWHNGRLAVADGYNGALRVMGLEAGRVSDLDDGSFLCTDLLCLPAAEPAGVTVDGPERLFMVDTNNHRVVEYRLKHKTYGTWAG